MKTRISFIGELHTSSEAREEVETTLKLNTVDTFFIEYANEEREGKTLQQALKDCKGKDEDTIRLNLQGYFSNLKVGDGKPNIKELTVLALQKNIDVIPVDMEVFSDAQWKNAGEKLDQVSEAYVKLPETDTWKQRENYFGEKVHPQIISPVEYEKLALRNNFMVKQISRFLPPAAASTSATVVASALDLSIPESGAGVDNRRIALFLCGANHFIPSTTQDVIDGAAWPGTLNPNGVQHILKTIRPDVAQETVFIGCPIPATAAISLPVPTTVGVSGSISLLAATTTSASTEALHHNHSIHHNSSIRDNKNSISVDRLNGWSNDMVHTFNGDRKGLDKIILAENTITFAAPEVRHDFLEFCKQQKVAVLPSENSINFNDALPVHDQDRIPGISGSVTEAGSTVSSTIGVGASSLTTTAHARVDHMRDGGFGGTSSPSAKPSPSPSPNTQQKGQGQGRE